MKIAVIDDAGFGSGKTGLFGKELYVELLSTVNQKLLGNEITKIVLGDFSNDKRIIGITGCNQPIIRALKDFKLEYKLEEVLKESRPDILHVNVLNARYPRAIVRLARKLDIPIVTTMHSWVYICPSGWSIYLPNFSKDQEPKARIRCSRCLWSLAKMQSHNTVWRIVGGYNQNFALHHLLRNSKAIISPSRLLAEKVSRFFTNKMYAIPNPISENLLESVPRYDGDGSITFFARLSYEKGANLLPEIAKEIPNIKIHVMGAGPLQNLIESASEKYRNIIYHGFVPDNLKIEILTQTSIIIMPALYTDTYPYSVLEAFALGKPVIAFDLGGPKEMIEDSGAGLLSKPFDIRDFCDKVKYLAGNRAEVRSMGISGRKWVEGKVNQKHYAKALKEVYNFITNTS